ncbi:MAG: hypothetical protein QM527_12285 [Alphaproteobacteria bacterium]|nr:hypothetical protein [Alphaproteobacteria bacterium]
MLKCLTLDTPRLGQKCLLSLATMCFAGMVWAQINPSTQAPAEFGFPTIPLKQLPEPLRGTYMGIKPEMSDRSRCAAAFDASGDPDKMTLKCSVHIRMAAEGARRAMNYCEEKRQELHIKAPCRLVQE